MISKNGVGLAIAAMLGLILPPRGSAEECCFSISEKVLPDISPADAVKQGLRAHAEEKYPLALEWFETADMLGVVAASFWIGGMYETGHAGSVDLDRAFRCAQRSAVRGYFPAQSRLGYYYDKGIGVPADDGKALYWYGEAIRAGSAEAEFGLGDFYYRREDYASALLHFRRAAIQGYPRADNMIGFMLTYGKGLAAQYPSEAMLWYERAAEQNLSDAQNNIGFAYEHGLGVSKDGDKAMQWYKRAAILNNTRALFHGGLMMKTGELVPQNFLEALTWLRSSAQQGDSEAAFQVGEMYEKGLGVQANRAEAISWYHQSAAGNYAAARDALVRLGEPP